MAALADAAGRALPEPGGWSGPAADACRSARSACASRLDTAAGVAGSAAAVLSRLAQAVEQARAEVARCGRELVAVEAERDRRAALVAAGLPDPGWADLDERLRSARARHEAAMQHYARAVTAAAQALAALYEQVPAAQRGMTTADRAWQAWRGFGRAFAVEPVQGVFALTLEAVVDRHQWAETVVGVPDALLDQARHPWRTAKQVLGLDGFGQDNGDWTESAGRAAGAMASIVGGGIGREARLLGGASRVVEREPLQSLAQTLDRVDLRNHEYRGTGELRSHGLTKHVAVGRERQAWRLRHERVPPGGLAEGETVDVSEFFDLATAEQWITQALNANLRPIDRWLRNGEKPKTISVAVPHDVGEVMRLHSDDRITIEQPSRLIVVLARDEDGVRVLTFYLTAPRREGGAA
ncbi:MAG TPA: RNase A-like domain-containing protein [Motilibacteraceae bacterium]|nr:RNase A-like domain-containing protein [Motilibacteraceae bacterium]